VLIEPEVVEEARGGNAGAFNRIVQAYRRRVLGTVGRLIGRPEDVEDVAQEVFVRLYHSLDQLRTPEVFEPWLYRLTTNACYDYLRRAKRRGEMRMADLSEQQVATADFQAGGKAFGDETRKTRVRDLMNALFREVSEQDRILLTMKEVEGLSLRELEKIYGVNEYVLKVRLFRARQRVLRAYKAARESGKL
jgi:RNA polymerase sigma-70 factor, ECF subfamily